MALGSSTSFLRAYSGRTAMRRASLPCTVALALLAGTPRVLLARPPSTCESLATLSLPATTIASAQTVPAGTFAPPAGDPIPGVPALCRVVGRIRPTSDSDIGFEVWMPSSGWNGRFQGLGTGGFGGTIQPRMFRNLARSVSRGHAVAVTDTGHAGDNSDASWAPGHPEKVIDFGYRAIHEMTVRAKAIVTAFYGSASRRSYFRGCSNGGRQALMEAQRFPDDYDGIIAGAPANFWTHQAAQTAWAVQATLANPAAYIPATKVPAIEAATLAACDALDRVKDGVIDDPAGCRFEPAVLQCADAASEGCLTSEQVGALQKLYSGPRTVTGQQLFPGRVPGGETGPGSWPAWVTGTAPGQGTMADFSRNFWGHLVFEKPDWDFRSFDLERDISFADAKLARILNATDPDLTRFRKRGGKLILYHGWSDAAIAPLNTVDYYESVAATMGAEQAATFVRLYMAPGMHHCSGGPGPNAFSGAAALRNDPEHDVEAALERWVEHGVPPGPIIAVKYRTDTEPSSGVVRTRPLCPYPQVARWKGSGSTDEATNFMCAPSEDGRLR